MTAALILAQRYWKLAAFGILALLLAVQTVRLGHERNVSERLRIDNNELRGELKAISSKKNEQAERTKVVIREVEKRIKVADKQADRVENAPLPGNCATPAEVMGSDL